MEVTEFQDASVIDVFVVVVHHRGALEVFDIVDFFFEIDGAPPQTAFTIIKVAIERAGVDHGSIWGLPTDLVADSKPVDFQLHVDIVRGRHVFQPCGVTVDGKSLIGVVEIPVIKGITHRKTRDIASWQVLRVRLPLLGGIAFHEGFVQRTTDQ